MRTQIAGVIFWLIAFMTTPALAIDGVDRVTVDGGIRILLVKGEFRIGEETSLLEAEAAAFSPNFVTFNSVGGDPDTAMRFGKRIRALGLSTLQTSPAQCAGACTLAFAGGVVRFAEAGSLGVNATSFVVTTMGAADMKRAAAVVAYLMEMGVDPRVFSTSLDYSGPELHKWTAEELLALKLTTAAGVDFSSLNNPAYTPPAAAETTIALRTPEERVREFVERFLAGWSRDTQQAIYIMEQAYEPSVSFYGKPMTRAEIMNEKWNFVTRWGVRAYWVKRGSEKVACADTCTYTAVINYYTYNEVNNRMSSGRSTLAIVWNPRTNRIASEDGKVIRADKKPKSPLRIIEAYQEENGLCRGGPGDAPDTMAACQRRDTIARMLDRADWCLGKAGEIAAQYKWHRCDFSSLRMSSPG